MTAINASFDRPMGRGDIRRLALGLRAMSGGGRHRHRHGSEGGAGGPGDGPRGFGNRGFGPWMLPFGGPGGPGGPGGGRGRGRGRKARRGDVRTAALLLLAEEPRNGYQIMQELEERSEGMWRPSPGSVYPALQQLEDEGLIRSEEADGRRLYHRTDPGRAFVEERPEDQRAPWESFTDNYSDQAAETGALMRDVAMAFAQVMHAGSEAQVAEAGKVLAETRRSLYRILADGEPAAEESASEESE
jgi:DNA-binding PadR family transcriptional regulator